MKTKLKIIAGIYCLITAAVACECPEPTYYSWEITEFYAFQSFNLERDKMRLELMSHGDEINEKTSLSYYLSEFGPMRAHATPKCYSEYYFLETEFTGISIKSNADFSIDEPAGTELKSYFKFVPTAEDGGFTEIMNRNLDRRTPYLDLTFQGELSEFPSKASKHIFTYTMYLANGDSLVTVADPIIFE